MTLNPVETLNTFSPALKGILRQRSLSQELVRTRAPFLRFTTGANMSELQDKLGSDFRVYNDYSFFSLGLHGWDNFTYKNEDIYGTKSSNGLIVGFTYKQGDQKIVYTHGTRIREVGTDGTATITKSGAQNYPPPGVTSAKIERLRNGNVLRATIEITVHTQEQLEVLDAVCFVPGMTCIIEWGSIQTTPTGPLFFGEQGLQTLDFTQPSVIFSQVENAKTQSRKDFIERWCEPNGFNYDWVVARIANVKTRLEDNQYKITVIAYGRADNIMYISAYATTSTLTPALAQSLDGTASSVNYYFRLNGEFSTLLKSIVTNTGSPYVNKVLSFTAPMDQAQIQQLIPASQTFNVGNELGFEDTYFLSFDFFVNVILNGDVLRIINSGLPDGDKIKNVIASLTANPQAINDPDSDTIRVGYNEHLRSVDPQICIIYNTKAALSNSAYSTKSISTALTAQQRIEQNANKVISETQRAADQINGVLNARSILQSAEGAAAAGVLNKIQDNKFGQEVTTTSDSTPITNGIYINSKAIQSAFMQARTIYEGLNTLLRNINAATENYWDLKLYYDDDLQAFRILDDNLKITSTLVREDNPIYEFNKALSSTNDSLLNKTTIGPDAIDVEISTDYPKLLFSKLAVAAINDGTISSEPIRTDIDFNLGARVGDVFLPTKQTATTETDSPQIKTRTVSLTTVASVLQSFKISPFAKRIDGNLGAANFSTRIENELNAGFVGQTIPQELTTWINNLLTKTRLLNLPEAKQLKTELEQFKEKGILTGQGYVALLNVAKIRAEGIIRSSKTNERNALNNVFGKLYSQYNPDSQPFGENFRQGEGVNRVQVAPLGINAEQYAGPGTPIIDERGVAGLSDLQRISAAQQSIKQNIDKSEADLVSKISSVTIPGSAEDIASLNTTQRQQEEERRPTQTPVTVGTPGRTGAGAVAARGGL